MQKVCWYLSDVVLIENLMIFNYKVFNEVIACLNVNFHSSILLDL